MKAIVPVSVREMVEFVLRRGSLGGSGEFASAGRALEGTRGHQRLQKAQPAGYESEVPVRLDLDGGEFVLRIQGRIDGVLTRIGGVVIEEIKTVRLRWHGQPSPLHWAQVKVYAYLFQNTRGRPDPPGLISVQLTYLNLDSGDITPFRETVLQTELERFFDSVAGEFLNWARQQWAWRQERDRSIRALPFPYARYRPGQEQLTAEAERALTNGNRIFVEAPTGSGKTMAILYAAVKAVGAGALVKLFYLTAKSPGKTVVEKALADLRKTGLRLRAVVLTAREKICFAPAGRPCDPELCPFAQGYYDRLKPALAAVLAAEQISKETLEEIGHRHQVCPFELGLDASVWCDLVIGDYNYAFDPRAFLRRYFVDAPDAYGFLIDEAHNLLERARDMFSAELSERPLSDLRRALREELPGCSRAIQRVLRALGTSGSDAADGGAGEVVRLAAVPAAWTEALRDFLAEAEAWLARNEPAEFREALRQAYFDVVRFLRTCDSAGQNYAVLCRGQTPESRWQLFCLDPAPLLKSVLKRAAAAVFFSGTLTPLDFFRRSLGGEEEDRTMRLPGVFPPENLGVFLHRGISTAYAARACSRDDVAGTIARIAQSSPGKHLVFFSSYEYLRDVLPRCRELLPGCSFLVQERQMDDAARVSFLARLEENHDGSFLGFAVLGGVFGEAIDLKGGSLAGVIVVGVGLPQVCLERNLIRSYFEQEENPGFDFAYTFPGVNRVLQAVGRLLRSESDRGVAVLIDRRFDTEKYRELLPPWWQCRTVETEAELAEELARWQPKLSSELPSGG